ncbi:hypothetical protein DPMN_072397 [Dreissena polymorpha]|uniref:Uncharacterized protein n=1 Tax=Dreissena polymorpha TaxID=45954 RepID=A0A9D3Z8M0_DREPO|nr:hypothetical protein DPMN_072397 [Dreissena polymorpha]
MGWQQPETRQWMAVSLQWHRLMNMEMPELITKFLYGARVEVLSAEIGVFLLRTCFGLYR